MGRDETGMGWDETGTGAPRPASEHDRDRTILRYPVAPLGDGGGDAEEPAVAKRCAPGRDGYRWIGRRLSGEKRPREGEEKAPFRDGGWRQKHRIDPGARQRRERDVVPGGGRSRRAAQIRMPIVNTASRRNTDRETSIRSIVGILPSDGAVWAGGTRLASWSPVGLRSSSGLYMAPVRVGESLDSGLSTVWREDPNLRCFARAATRREARQNLTPARPTGFPCGQR